LSDVRNSAGEGEIIETGIDGKTIEKLAIISNNFKIVQTPIGGKMDRNNWISGYKKIIFWRLIIATLFFWMVNTGVVHGETELTLSGTLGNNGWYLSDVNINLDTPIVDQPLIDQSFISEGGFGACVSSYVAQTLVHKVIYILKFIQWKMASPHGML
jgi:hypothetical protein